MNFCDKLSLTLSVIFFLSASTAATYIFIAPTCTTIIITLEPYALNDEIQHFIVRFNKISSLHGVGR
jgi:hypothetical protein